MRCPVCPASTLSISSREGVEIDYCPECRGVWLDRGELDKIIDRVAASLPPVQAEQPAAPTAPVPRSPEPPRRPDERFERRDDDRHDRDDRYYKRKKRRGFLDDLFDFD